MLTTLCLFTSIAFATPPEPPQPPSQPPASERGARGGAREESAERIMKHFPEIAAKIGMSSEQKSAVEKLYYESKLVGIDMKAKGEKARLELERVLLADAIDEKAALKAFETAAVAETDVRRNDLKLMLGIRKQLTAEQWTALRSLRDDRRGERQDDRHGGGERGDVD